MKRPQYDFEKLEVYQRAIEFSEKIFTMTEQFPSHVQYSLGDQLRRAALSICNNMAEGSGKRGLAKRQFYGYSIDSARECVPMLEIAHRRQFIDRVNYELLDGLCFRITSMLYALLRASN